MNWATLSDFLDMGGYALYVWGAYLMAGAALVWELLMALHRRRGALVALADRLAAEDEAP